MLKNNFFKRIFVVMLSVVIVNSLYSHKIYAQANTQYFTHQDITQGELGEYVGPKAQNTENIYGNDTSKLLVGKGTVTRTFEPITSGKVYFSTMFLYKSGSVWLRLKNSDDVTLINIEGAKSGNINLNGMENKIVGGPLDGGTGSSNQAFKKANVGTKTWQLIALETDLDQKDEGIKFNMSIYLTNDYKGEATDWGIPAIVKDIPVADTNSSSGVHTDVFDIAKLELVSNSNSAFYLDGLRLSSTAPELPQYTIPKSPEEENLEEDMNQIGSYVAEYINNPLITFENDVLKANKRTFCLPSKGKNGTKVTWSVENPSQYIDIQDTLVTLTPSAQEAELVYIVAQFTAENTQGGEDYTGSKRIPLSMPKASGAAVDLEDPQVLETIMDGMRDKGIFKDTQEVLNHLDDEIKIEEFVTMLLNAFDVDTEFTKVKITKDDIDYSAVYAPYIIAAFQLSLEKNPGSDSYGVGETIDKQTLRGMLEKMTAIDQNKLSDHLMDEILN